MRITIDVDPRVIKWIRRHRIPGESDERLEDELRYMLMRYVKDKEFEEHKLRQRREARG